jgi:hypothetical protein
MIQYAVIRQQPGKTIPEIKLFNETASLKEVMDWGDPGGDQTKTYDREVRASQIQISLHRPQQSLT